MSISANPAPNTVAAEEAAVPIAVSVAAPLPTEPEYRAVPASWMKDDAVGVLRGGSRGAAAKRIRYRPVPADQVREAPGRDVPDLRLAGPNR
jgi:hypothetical protein